MLGFVCHVELGFLSMLAHCVLCQGEAHHGEQSRIRFGRVQISMQ